MFRSKSKIAAVLAALLCTVALHAQDNKALLDMLVQKGVLNKEEAAKLQKDLAKANATAAVSTSGSKHLAKLSLNGRFQVQYAGLGTDIANTTADPAGTRHFFLRRIYLGAKAEVGAGWSGHLNYDFAGTTFDAAFVQWKQSDKMVIDVGFRKAPIGLEEWYTSSGNLKAIERSPGTRFFAESNNGRRLGAAGYRTGVFLGGKVPCGFFYNVAFTNPERDESAAGVAGTGTAANNNLSYWGNLGYAGKTAAVAYTISASAGLLPDQGGKTLGAGNDLTVYNAFVLFTAGKAELQLEYFGSSNEHGVSATRDSSSSAISAQSAYKTGNFEWVARYSAVDSDGRGLTTSDLIRSAPSGGTMEKLTEWYAGLNWYIRGNDVKWQLGCLYGESKDSLTGATAKATTTGVRSQLQLQY